MVTLTQAQFDQILETIGELSVMNEPGASDKHTTDSINFDAPLPQVSVPPTPASQDAAQPIATRYTTNAWHYLSQHLSRSRSLITKFIVSKRCRKTMCCMTSLNHLQWLIACNIRRSASQLQSSTCSDSRHLTSHCVTTLSWSTKYTEYSRAGGCAFICARCAVEASHSGWTQTSRVGATAAGRARASETGWLVIIAKMHRFWKYTHINQWAFVKLICIYVSLFVF